MRYLLPILLFLILTTPARADVGCDEFYAEVSEAGHVVLVSPGGTAPSLSAQGVVVLVEILDCSLEPIAHYPRQDIWIDSLVPGELGLCQGGTMADADTDSNGMTTISGPLAAGGATTSGMTLVVSAWRQDYRVTLDLDLVSPDLDGDLDVDLVDFGIFGLDFGRYGAWRSDFDPDGVVDLGDFALFGLHFGETCP